MKNLKTLLGKEFVNSEELEEIEENELVERTEFNGISGKDGSSKWYSIYLNNGEEYQVYVRA
ncbi:uncharacterized protein CBO05P1_234 [Clostridium botulinum B str. Osaka05]|uniref:Uncharacterized protein n=1 Tax=Clostridium botulinum B str. Osaka05 TaxID=1407017 RepID=A0A060N8V3_CLOBO|nr:hypothetical protein [Clostridium botulinum]BAO04953.1 uncharacterized protein CBO05P1_234 [Clostridium botulinum B str. Osaka05]